METEPLSEEHSDDDAHAAVLYLSFHGAAPQLGGSRHLLGGVSAVHLGRGPAFAVRRTRDEGTATLHIELPDASVSLDHATLRRHGALWKLHDRQSRNGCYLNGVRVREVSPIKSRRTIQLGKTFAELTLAQPLPARAPADLGWTDLAQPPAFCTLDPKLAQHFAEAQQIAKTPLSIIILGETGTGKELAARALHNASRRPGPLTAVNCAAIPEALVESQLFGHRAGAFSGASNDQMGFIQASDGGTLFLDELGELPLRAQAALLRVLQEREVQPLGATRAISIDLRVIAATHRDLAAMVAAGTFRQDLYERLADFQVKLPPLRRRRHDLGSLIRATLGEGAASCSFGRKAARALFHYQWPGNIRELSKCMALAQAISKDGPIRARHLPEAVTAAVPSPSLSPQDEVLAEQVRGALREHGGNLTHAAEALGKKRQQLQRWCKRLHIDPAAYRS